jgi:hypothetical protein
MALYMPYMPHVELNRSWLPQMGYIFRRSTDHLGLSTEDMAPLAVKAIIHGILPHHPRRI